jgi:hypothetical protein
MSIIHILVFTLKLAAIFIIPLICIYISFILDYIVDDYKANYRYNHYDDKPIYISFGKFLKFYNKHPDKCHCYLYNVYIKEKRFKYVVFFKSNLSILLYYEWYSIKHPHLKEKKVERPNYTKEFLNKFK